MILMFFKKLNYIWRLFATGLCFAVFGIGGLILGTVIFPLITLLPVNEKKKRNTIRGIISWTFMLFFWMMHSLRVLKFKVDGKAKIQEDKSCLVIANHPSLIDVVALISMYPNACCIVKKELWDNFFLRRVVSGAGYIPNEDPESLLRSCQESIDRGDVLIIFPEGTRTTPGQEMMLQRGAAHIALRLKCPIRTIQIDVTPATLTKNLPWYSIPNRRVDFKVLIKDLLSVSEYIESDMPMSLASRRLTKKMKESIEIKGSY